MKIGAYQFAVTDDIKYNLEIIQKVIIGAEYESIKLLVFPECALTGYPPCGIENSSVIDFQELKLAYKKLQNLADENAMHIIIGTITYEVLKHGICYSDYYNHFFYDITWFFIF